LVATAECEWWGCGRFFWVAFRCSCINTFNLRLSSDVQGLLLDGTGCAAPSSANIGVAIFVAKRKGFGAYFLPNIDISAII
jgi:hypothetical protein